MRTQFNLIIPSLSRDIPGTGQLGPTGGLPLWGQSAALLSSRSRPALGLLPPFPAGSRPPPPPLSFSPCLGFLNAPNYRPSAATPSGAAVGWGSAPHHGRAPSPRPFSRARPGRPPPAPRAGAYGAAGAPRHLAGSGRPPNSTVPIPGTRRAVRGGAVGPGLRRCAGVNARSQGRERGSASHPSPGGAIPGPPSLLRSAGAPAAPSDLLRAAKSSSPAAERGKPRTSPVSSGHCCRSTSLRFPTDGLAGRRLRPAPPAPRLSVSRRRFLAEIFILEAGNLIRALTRQSPGCRG